MTYIDFAELKAKVGIEQVLAMLRITLKPHGDRLRGICPVCKSGGDRALVVTPAKGVFYCFGACKSGGDMIELTARVKNYAGEDRARQAALDIGRYFAIGNTSPKRAVEPEQSQGPLRPLDYLDLDHACLQELGISKETCEHFGAGYAPKGIMRGRFAIAVHDAEGVLLAYCGRAVKGEEPTLIFPKGFAPESVIFNAHRAHDGPLYATRDPLAVLTAFECGIDNVVAFMGDISVAQVERLSLLMHEKNAQPLELF